MTGSAEMKHSDLIFSAKKNQRCQLPSWIKSKLKMVSWALFVFSTLSGSYLGCQCWKLTIFWGILVVTSSHLKSIVWTAKQTKQSGGNGPQAHWEAMLGGIKIVVDTIQWYLQQHLLISSTASTDILSIAVVDPWDLEPLRCVWAALQSGRGPACNG